MKPLITSVLLLIWIAVLASTVRVNAQDPLDGPARIFNDDLLNNLVGDWKLKREIQGRTVENTVTAEWVLNHQFLRIHMKDVKTPATTKRWFSSVMTTQVNAMWFTGWMFLVDDFQLGYGKRNGNSIKFVFEYPDGPFHNTFTWTSETKSWSFLMEQKDKTGKWVKFAEDTLIRP